MKNHMKNPPFGGLTSLQICLNFTMSNENGINNQTTIAMKSLILIIGSLILLYNLSFSQIKVHSTGKVKIGATTDPSAILDIKGNTYSSYFYYGTNEDTYIRPGKSTGNVVFDYGKVGIGISAPSSLLNIHGSTQNLEISNTSETEAGILFYDHGSESTEYGKILFNCGANRLNFYCNNSNPVLSLLPSRQTIFYGNFNMVHHKDAYLKYEN